MTDSEMKHSMRVVRQYAINEDYQPLYEGYCEYIQKDEKGYFLQIGDFRFEVKLDAAHRHDGLGWMGS